MGHVVTAAGLVAQMDSDTGEGYFYRGDVLPAGVRAAECKRLESLGLVAQVAEPLLVVVDEGGLVDLSTEPAYPDGEPSESWKVEQLRAYADAKNVNLSDATLKADILKAVQS